MFNTVVYVTHKQGMANWIADLLESTCRACTCKYNHVHV